MDELYHHQIKGAKWGKRNGPPYPLGAGDHSAAEIAANPSLQRKAEREKAKEAKKEAKYKRLVAKNQQKDLARLTRAANKLEKKSLVLQKKAAAKSGGFLIKGKQKRAVDEVKKLSDEDLQKSINRLTQEKRYMDLQRDLNPERKKRESFIAGLVRDTLKDVGKKAMASVLTASWNTYAREHDHEDWVIEKKGDKNGNKGDKK